MSGIEEGKDLLDVAKEYLSKYSIKQIFITTYLSIAFICGLGLWWFGEDAHRGFAFNLGKALVWPVSTLPEVLIGSTIVAVLLAGVYFLLKGKKI